MHDTSIIGRHQTHTIDVRRQMIVATETRPITQERPIQIRTQTTEGVNNEVKSESRWCWVNAITIQVQKLRRDRMIEKTR